MNESNESLHSYFSFSEEKKRDALKLESAFRIRDIE